MIAKGLGRLSLFVGPNLAIFALLTFLPVAVDFLRHADPAPKPNPATYIVLQIVLMLAVSLLMALVLDHRTLGRGFFRTAPMLVAVALVLKAAGDTAGDGASFLSIWAGMGCYTLILLAGLQAIPTDLYEAASIDATPRWRMFSRITLPLLMPSLSIVVALGLVQLAVIWALLPR